MHGLMEQIGASAHGQELFAANTALAGEITWAVRAKLVSLLEIAFIAADAPGEIKLGHVDARANDLAILLLAAMDGIKHLPRDGMQANDAIALLMRLAGAALDRV